MKQILKGELNDGLLTVTIRQNLGSLAEADIVDSMNEVTAQADTPGLKGVIVDFSHVEYFGSLMLESLRHLWNHVDRQNARMVLCRVSAIGREILEISHFDRLWPVVPSRDEAIALLKTPSAGEDVAS